MWIEPESRTLMAPSCVESGDRELAMRDVCGLRSWEHSGDRQEARALVERERTDSEDQPG